MLQAQFRNVQVVVKITCDLDVPDWDNAAFHELMARDGKLHEFGLQLFSQLLPFVEHRVVEENPELDVRSPALP